MKIANLLSLFLLILASISWTSCTDELEDPVIHVLPKTFYINASANQFIEFKLEAAAGDADLRNVTITSKPDGGLTETILDTSITGQTVHLTYVYLVPPTEGGGGIDMTFRVYDQDGDTGGAIRQINITGSSLLTESTGHHLYSRYAEDAITAFNLDNLESLSISSTTLDSSKVDLVNRDSSDDDDMSRTLESYSGIKFTRSNQFNYPEATQQTAMNAFTSSNETELISDIQIDDILITEYDTLNNKYAVIKITDIVDNEGTDGDRFEFNVKK